MNITPIHAQSFKGRLVREIKPGVKISLNEALDTFDKQINKRLDEIEKLKKQKQAMYDFDTFMHSSEVQKIVESLPDDTKIKLGEVYDEEFHNDISDFEPDKPMLSCPEVESEACFARRILPHHEAIELSFYDKCQNRDYTINERGILSWLNKVSQVLSNDDEE